MINILSTSSIRKLDCHRSSNKSPDVNKEAINKLYGKITDGKKKPDVDNNLLEKFGLRVDEPDIFSYTLKEAIN